MPDLLPPSAPVLSLNLTYRGHTVRLTFQQENVTIRRRTRDGTNQADVLLDDTTVSRRHVVIRWRGRNYWVSDEGSLTGTFHNDQRVEQHSWWPLENDSELTFGETRAVVGIDRPGNGSVFDVFLCHNSADKPRVRQLASSLRDAGINPWLDESELMPASGFVTQLSDILSEIGSAVIVWGARGSGQYQQKEIEYLQKMSVTENLRVVPVILESAVRDPEWPVFIDLLQRIDFRKTSPDPMQKLCAVLSKQAG